MVRSLKLIETEPIQDTNSWRPCGALRRSQEAYAPKTTSSLFPLRLHRTDRRKRSLTLESRGLELHRAATSLARTSACTS